MRLDFCVEGVQVTGTRHPSIDSMEGQVYGGIPEDSEDLGLATSRVAMPIPTVKSHLESKA